MFKPMSNKSSLYLPSRLPIKFLTEKSPLDSLSPILPATRNISSIEIGIQIISS